MRPTTLCFVAGELGFTPFWDSLYDLARGGSEAIFIPRFSLFLSDAFFWERGILFVGIHQGRRMTHLVAAGFDNAYTAFLARAALARLRKELSLSWHDVAVVIREERDETIYLEMARLCNEREMHGSCWETLISMLFAPDSQITVDDRASTMKLAELGIDVAARTELADRLRMKASSLFVFVAGPVIRDKVLGVIRGFQGEITLTRLKGEHRKNWCRTLNSGKRE